MKPGDKIGRWVHMVECGKNAPLDGPLIGTLYIDGVANAAPVSAVPHPTLPGSFYMCAILPPNTPKGANIHLVVEGASSGNPLMRAAFIGRVDGCAQTPKHIAMGVLHHCGAPTNAEALPNAEAYIDGFLSPGTPVLVGHGGKVGLYTFCVTGTFADGAQLSTFITPTIGGRAWTQPVSFGQVPLCRLPILAGAEVCVEMGSLEVCVEMSSFEIVVENCIDGGCCMDGGQTIKQGETPFPYHLWAKDTDGLPLDLGDCTCKMRLVGPDGSVIIERNIAAIEPAPSGQDAFHIYLEPSETEALEVVGKSTTYTWHVEIECTSTVPVFRQERQFFLTVKPQGIPEPPP